MATLGYDPHLTLWYIFHGVHIWPHQHPTTKLSEGQRKTIGSVVGLVTEKGSWPEGTTFLDRFKKMRKEKIGLCRLKKDEALLVQGLLDCLNDYQPYSPWTNPDCVRDGLYDHFKGGVYLFQGLASWASGEGEPVVEYISLNHGSRHVRLVTQWCEVVQWPDGEYRSRFVHRGPANTPEPSFKVPSPTK